MAGLAGTPSLSQLTDFVLGAIRDIARLTTLVEPLVGRVQALEARQPTSTPAPVPTPALAQVSSWEEA